ncbi:MAG: hypothetical protein E7211_19590, partial [Clostridium lundense]|nr:hypothetical protein [Clostridium lundense]
TTTRGIAWTSSNTGVVSVSPTGTDTADSEGKVSVTLTANGYGTATVIANTADGNKAVVCNVLVPVRTESVTLSASAIDLKPGQSSALTAFVLPENAYSKNVTWTSDKTSVATVDQNGAVTAVAAGTAIITATNKNGTGGADVVGRCTVKVSSFELAPAALSMIPRETKTLAAMLNGEAAGSVTWESSNTAVATVEGGVVTAVAAGTATVTATERTTGLTATCAVTVTAVSLEKIELSESQLTIEKGNSAALTATLTPADATVREVTWTTTNAGIVSVTPALTDSADAQGKITVTLHAVGEGTATISAITTDGRKVVTCRVLVPVKVKDITLDPDRLTLEVGEDGYLTATFNQNGPAPTDKTVTWESDRGAVATVDQNGKVTALSAGEANITVTAQDGSNVTATCTVTVNPVAVRGVTISQRRVTTHVGNDDVTLIATVTPSNAADPSVTWTIDKADVAAITNNGDGTATVRAEKIGEAQITVTTNDGKFTDTCYYTVLATPVTSITLSETEWTTALKNSETLELTADVAPSNATDKTVVWSSSNPAVAEVHPNTGVVTPKAAGTAAITAHSVSTPSVTAVCIVNVTTTPVTSISLSAGELNLDLGEVAELTASVLRADADDKTVIWSCSDTQIANISVDADDNHKLTVTAGTTKGRAVITALTRDGGKTATCVVNVWQKVDSVSLNKTELSLGVGKSETLTATVSPGDAEYKNVTWSSSDTDVATVDQAGRVTARSTGSATITVTTADQSKTAECAVTVTNVLVSSLDIPDAPQEMTVGDQVTLSVNISPADATDKTVTWSSSNEAVATVDQNGKVTAEGAGTVTITVAAQDSGKKSTTCNIQVYSKAESVTITGDDILTITADTQKPSTTLTAEVGPVGAKQNVMWSISNESIATLGNPTDVNGKSTVAVTAQATGTVVITAISEANPAAKKNFTVTVKRHADSLTLTITPPTGGASLNGTALHFDLSASPQPATLTATASPSGLTDELVWTVTDNNGNILLTQGQTQSGVSTASVYALKSTGDTPVTITVSAKDGDAVSASKSCTVTVENSVTGVTLNYPALTLTRLDTAQLTASVTGGDAPAVMWESSDSAIVSVDDNGGITAKAVGSAVVTARAGGQFATCSVTVNPILVNKLLVKSATVLILGNTETLSPTVQPENADNRDLNWSSGNNNVVTVDADGKLTAVGV